MKHYEYEEAVSYILKIPRFLSKNKMEDTKAFLQWVKPIDRGEKVFHIAGTNGKGSVCSFIGSLSRNLGASCGMFTSPHLVDIRERIKIDGKSISKEEFLAAFEHIMHLLAGFNEEVERDYHPSFFEFLFFMAVYIFDQNKVDTAIYEVGLGGMLDATNSLYRTDISVITAIGMDHMEYLGSDLESIAGQKAGIIRENTPVVYLGNQSYSHVIENEADRKNSTKLAVVSPKLQDVKLKDKMIDFCYESSYYSSVTLQCLTRARYQGINASLALRAMETVYGSRLTPDIMRRGIAEMNWPGRMQEMEEGIVVDGGHNVEGIEAFLDSVSYDGCPGQRYLIYSGVSDKQIDKIGCLIEKSGLFDRIAVCGISSARGLSPKVLAGYFEDAAAYGNVREAMADIKAAMQPTDRLYICGSLYLVGEVEAIYGFDS